MGARDARPEPAWAPHPLRPYRPMIVGVAPTGAVPGPGDNPAVPLTVEAIVADAITCAKAGATSIHVHVRDADGRPTHDADQYARIIAGIRQVVPEVVLCATTSSRVGSDLAARMTALDLPADVRPDLASLTLGSGNFPRTVNANPPDEMVALLERMGEQGVRPELEVFELGMVNTLHILRERGLIPDPVIVHVLLGSMGTAPAFVGDLAHLVDRLPEGAEWGGAGIGIFQRPMVVASAVLGGNVRTGLEDNPRGHGELPWTNADAVAFAVDAARLCGREIATATETRARFGLGARP